MDRRITDCKATGRAPASWLLILLAGQLAGCLELGASTATRQLGSGFRITSPTFVSVAEQVSTGFYTATSSGSGTILFSITGGADASQFSIDSTSGVLSFTAPPDFERPADANSDRNYEVQLQAENSSGNTARRTVRVEVTDVNEAPIFLSRSTATVSENWLTAYTAFALDPDTDRISYAIDGGVDAAVFSIDRISGRLSFNAEPDFEAPLDADGDNRYEVDLIADDGKGLSAGISVSVSVTDVSRHRIEIGFPTPGANLGGVDATTVTGRLRDDEDGVVDAGDIAFVDVNGTFALLDMNDASRWMTSTAAVKRATDLSASVQSTNGALHSVSTSNQNEAIVVRPDLMVFGRNADELLVADSAGTGSLVSMDLDSGNRSLIADIAPGSGPPILFPQAAIFDANTSRILLLDPLQTALLSLDLVTGDRAYVSGGGTGSGPAFSFPGALVMDPNQNRVLVADSGLAAILSVDLATGDRSIVSDPVTGFGIPLLFPTVLTIDPPAGRVLVADAFHEAIIGVDLATGNRSLVADATSGTNLDFPIAVDLDAANDRLLLLDSNLQAIVSVDLASGAGTTVSGPSTGSGPDFTQPRSMAFDAMRDRVFVSDLTLQRILAVDLATGDRTPIARSATGAGPSIAAGSALSFLKDDGSVLVAYRQADGGGLTRVDIDGGLRSIVADAVVGNGPMIDAVTGVDVNPTSGSAVVADDSLDALLTVDLVTGDRSILSSTAVGGGPVFTEPTAVVFDAAGDRALVLDTALDALIAVDTVSGNRTVLSSASGPGTGPALSDPVALGMDAAGNRVLVADADLVALLSIDLTTGDRTIIADGTTGGGVPLFTPTAVAVDAASGRAFVAGGNNPAAIYAVDLTSGDRTLIASPADHTSPPLLAVTGLHYDPEYDRLFALDSDIEGVLVIEAVSGQRAIVSR